jgi:hypothetical protein
MIAGNDAYVPAVALNETGIIGGRSTVGVGVSKLQHLAKKTLRGLYCAQGPTIGSVQHTTLVVDHLDGVGNRESGHDGRMAISHGADDPGEQVRGRQTPGDVMNQHDAIVRAQCAQACFDRSRPIHPSGHYIHPGVLTKEVGGGPALPDVRDGRHDDHVLHLRTTKDAPQCVSQ